MVTSSTPPTTVFLRLIRLDQTLSFHLHRLSSPIPRLILLALEISGHGLLFFPLTLSVLISLRLRILAILLSGGLLDLILIGISKQLFQRPRPSYNKDMHVSFSVDHWSFPSGHSSRVWLVATILHMYGTTSQLAVGIWALATSISRVFLGRHFCLDVLVGSCLGIVEGVLVFCIFRRFDSMIRSVLAM